MYSVLIADDESIIRRGLKKIVKWEELGFTIIGEVANGKEALSFLMEKNPDVVLIDIKMPIMDGLEVIRCARASNYQGKFIILSGYSDFKYAQRAIRHNVNFYLTKPIDDDELKASLLSLYDQLKAESMNDMTINLFRVKAKTSILVDLINGSADISKINMSDINMIANSYQVIIHEKYSHNIADISYNFAELLKVSNHDNNSFETLTFNENEVIILKGDYAINRFQNFLERFNYELKPQKGSPLDSLFIAYGRVVSLPTDISISYKDADQLLQRRFFCKQDQHTLGYQILPLNHQKTFRLSHEYMDEFCNKLINYIHTLNRNIAIENIHEIEAELYYCDDSISDIKVFLTDLILQIKEKINNQYSAKKIPFPTNSQIINFIDTRNYLFEIIAFYIEQLNVILNTIGTTSSNNIIDGVLYYIQNNYMENLKLETISALFGYNSSYLGKLFHAKTGESFNAYIDNLRVIKSIELLKRDEYKVYEIAEKVGYGSVEYFYIKFKKYTGLSPNEYRKQHLDDEI